MIKVTISTKNFRFLYSIDEVLSKIKEIKTNHILPKELVTNNNDVIITTETEKVLIQSNKIFIPKAFNHYYLFSNIFLIANNRKKFEEIVIGIDPGKTIGFAVIAEGKKILGTSEFFIAVDAVKEAISIFFNVETDKFRINIGKGGGKIKEEIAMRLKSIFHDKVPINHVNENFSSQSKNHLTQTKQSKNINAALNIACRDT
ncbi:MAG: hypothetical protein KGD64_05255 [Candidatus Heimdallarchaeota archaeon]|nr:hypothetical protein [Candidatus Heimdallarchaeota archaeon]